MCRKGTSLLAKAFDSLKATNAIQAVRMDGESSGSEGKIVYGRKALETALGRRRLHHHNQDESEDAYCTHLSGIAEAAFSGQKSSLWTVITMDQVTAAFHFIHKEKLGERLVTMPSNHRYSS